MKTNVGIGILLFCCGAVFAFLLMQGDNKTGEPKREVGDQTIGIPLLPPVFTKDNAGGKDAVMRPGRLAQSNALESSENGRVLETRRNTNMTRNSNTASKGTILNSHSSVRGKLMITRNQHAIHADHIPVTREHTIETTVTSDHVIGRSVDSVNPQPGMLFSAYNCPEWMGAEQLRESNSTLPERPALKTGIDKGGGFSANCATGVKAVAIRWEGFLKCKRAATYTFTIDKGEDTGFENGYSVRVNNDLTVTGYGRNAFDADLKVGFNKVEIVCQFGGDNPFDVSAKPKGSVAEPTKLSPGMLFYDARPELMESGL
ncbi:MAG: hypothetical protein J6Z49_02150 [Kiritimatiellae bacterium]|nr:hypothetical protein [Kiritimatiellia bacterium]